MLSPKCKQFTIPKMIPVMVPNSDIIFNLPMSGKPIQRRFVNQSCIFETGLKLKAEFLWKRQRALAGPKVTVRNLAGFNLIQLFVDVS